MQNNVPYQLLHQHAEQYDPVKFIVSRQDSVQQWTLNETGVTKVPKMLNDISYSTIGTKLSNMQLCVLT